MVEPLENRWLEIFDRGAGISGVMLSSECVSTFTEAVNKHELASLGINVFY